jgi:hypothetical protein
VKSNDNHDPVNRWATEHYGFEEDFADAAPAPSATRETRAPVARARRPRAGIVPRARRRSALIASGVLSLAMIAGIGVVTIAAADEAGGPGGGPPGGVRSAVVQFDGDVGGHAGNPGRGDR